jgi:hypothetical protein
MAYPGDFVAANRAARDAAINFFRMAKEPKRRLALRRIYFRLWKGWPSALYCAFNRAIYSLSGSWTRN